MTAHRLEALALVALLVPAGAAEELAGAGPLRAEAPQEEIQRLDAWPEVASKDRVREEIDRLRKARTEEMGRQAHEALVGAGAGVVPHLLPAFGKERDVAACERIEAVLDAVTDAHHTRLLAHEFPRKSGLVRIWALKRVARFPDPGVRAQAEQALERAQRGKQEEAEDDEERYAAALCCASAGSLLGIDLVAARAERAWSRSGHEIRTALEAVRGPEATRRIGALLADPSRERQVVGLQLLAGCGDKESSTALVRPFLDSTDNTLRVAAINALRGIVDGDPPLDTLPVFEAIERANEWKRRL